MTLINDFTSIVLNDIPLIDVRAPIEYDKGTFPNSVNLPLMSNSERKEVGICYKQKGSNQALELGYKLVSGEIKEQRVNAWIDFIKKHPNSYLFCFRGGQRSYISQKWLKEKGFLIPYLDGGYKAFRNYLIQESINISANLPSIIVAGATGSGKTLLLNEIDNSLDLEGLANHRGSAFGAFISPQPVQINFENKLAYKLIKIANIKKIIILEDENINIGRVNIPKKVFDNFHKNGKFIQLIIPFEQRVDNIFNDYVLKEIEQFKEVYGDSAVQMWLESMANRFDKIKQKLGDKRHKEYKNILLNAYNSNNLYNHKEWIELLLKEYYDPMYNYQIENKRDEIIYKGNKEELLEYIENIAKNF